MTVTRTVFFDASPLNRQACNSSFSGRIWKLSFGRRSEKAKQVGMMLVKSMAVNEGDDVEEEKRRVLPVEDVERKENSSIFLGLEADLNRLSKWIVSASFSLAVLVRHDWEALWVTFGAVLNVLLCHTLKRILNHERPTLALRSDPGMPSSHAQSISFIVSFLILSIVERLGTSAIGLILSVCTLIFGSYLTWLRVSQNLHTVSQVAVGAAVGYAFSVLWIWSWKAAVSKAVASSLLLKVIVCLCSSSSSIGFLLYTFRHWFKA